jgi:hypothetical protein
MRSAHARARVRAAALLMACAAATASGCSTSEEGGVPVSCQATGEAVRRALDSAPEPVTLDGTAISDCFARGSESGEVQTIGFAFTEAAAELSREARQRPEGDAALELGYLVGAVRAGAGRTQGIHDELVRRVEQELHGVDTSSDAFAAGERAGLESG